LAGSRSQCLCDLAIQVRVAVRFICKGVEDAKLFRPKFDRLPFHGPFFIQRERLSRL
jgi:hypothetical protein